MVTFDIILFQVVHIRVAEASVTAKLVRNNNKFVGKEIRRFQSPDVEVQDVPLAGTRGKQLFIILAFNAFIAEKS